ncbi:MAG: hypothetical protein QXY70_01845 [Nanopusillaceae archaeon]
MEYWEQKFKNFFSQKENKIYSYYIFSKCIFGQFNSGKIKEILEDKKRYLSEEFFEIFEYLIKEIEKNKSYTASIFPTMLSFKVAKNFFLKNEKFPNREEIFYFLYLISTGIFCKNLVVNLITSNEQAWENFLEKLKSEKQFIIGLSDEKETTEINGIRVDSLVRYLYINKKNIPLIERNILVFILLNFFVVWWLKENKKIRVHSLADLKNILPNEGIDERSALIIFEYGKEKKKIFIYPRINEFIQKWYFKYLQSGEEKDLFLPKFLFTLVDFDDKESFHHLDKFLYFLLRGYVNGELLDKLMQSKINQLKKAKKQQRKLFGIKNAKEFFQAIS